VSALDIVVVAAYFSIVFGIGAYFFRRAKTSRSYVLADRSVGWVAVGASLFATNISSEHFIGLGGGVAVRGHYGHRSAAWTGCAPPFPQTSST
jgi:solute:Na+ symporter, SSS family